MISTKRADALRMFIELISAAGESRTFLLGLILLATVIMVNGWTDAPNAIATCVSTRAMSCGGAVVMASAANLIGVFSSLVLGARVASTVSELAFLSEDGYRASIALISALCAVILWAILAWRHGLPTSESHALIAGICGSSVAGGGSFSAEAWLKVLCGLAASLGIGFLLGFASAKLIVIACRRLDRRKTVGFFSYAQIFGAALTAFFHGAQDGQKFLGIFAVMTAVNGVGSGRGEVNTFACVAVALFMFIGTACGGKRIIKSVGIDLVRLKPYQGFASDIAAGACMLFTLFVGLPISTTHTKASAIMGVGAARSLRHVNMKIMRDMLLAWIFTFPGCGIIGFLLTRLLMRIL